MVSLIKVRAADTKDALVATGNLVHPIRLFEACQPVVDFALNIIAKLEDRQRPAQGGGGGGGGVAVGPSGRPPTAATTPRKAREGNLCNHVRVY